MGPVLLIDNYDSFTFNLYQAFAMLGFDCRVVRNDAITLEEIERMAPRAVVLSPGPGRPAEAGVTVDVIRRFAGRFPLLGVCLGHQAIGEAFGGEVVRAPRLMHGKVSPIFHDGKGVYRGLPNPFPATRYHSLVVERRSLPKCLVPTSKTKDGILMGVRHRKLPVEGVQFHPESIMTTEGMRLLGNFLGVAA